MDNAEKISKIIDMLKAKSNDTWLIEQIYRYVVNMTKEGD